ncbi:YccF domain-containing protein [Silvimonas sp. JCM 19000]
MRFIGNVLWFVLGGFWMGLGWWLAGLVALITIVGIPWARACFVIGAFSFWPFGKEAVKRNYITGRHDVGTGALGFIGNLIWFVFAGWWLALGHVAAALANFITIIGIPFGIQHLKLALIALAPVGQTVVPSNQRFGLR